MAKTKISEFSANPANNTDIDNINIAEGCAPSGINDAIRELMAQLKDFQVGSAGDSFNGPVGTTTAAAGAFTTLSATGVTTVQAGTSSAPAITTSGDTNTGIFFPAADTIAFTEGGTEAMRIDSSGNVGIRTSSPAVRLDVAGSNQTTIARTYAGSTSFTQYVDDSAGGVFLAANTVSGTNAKFLAFQTVPSGGAATERARIDSSGNVGIGTSSPFFPLDVAGAIRGNSWIGRTNVSAPTADCAIYRAADNTLGFSTANTERARIDSSGNLLVGTTSVLGSEKFNVTQAAAATCIVARLSSGPYNNSSYPLFYGYDGVTTRFYIPSNGGVYNYSANNVNLSDERTKTQIENAGSYLDKICAIPVRTFKYKDQTDNLLNLGVIAQEVEAIAPELVNFDGFGDDIPEDGVPLKGVYQTDLQYALMKCIQEQQAIITALTARVAALESQP